LAGLSVTFVADVAWSLSVLSGTFATSSPAIAGWVLSYVFLGTAALHPSMRQLSEAQRAVEAKLSGKRIAALAAAALVGPVVVVIQEARGEVHQLSVILGGSVMLFLLVLLRMVGLIRSHERAEKRERTLREVVASLVVAPDRESIYAATLRAAQVLVVGLPNARISIATVSEDTIPISLKGDGESTEVDRREINPAHLPKAIYSDLIRGSSVLIEKHVAAGPAHGLSPQPGESGVFVIPLLTQQELVGVITVGSSRVFPEEMSAGLQALGLQSSLALQNIVLTDAALRRNAELLQAQSDLLDLAHDAILMIDPDTSAIRFWSRGAEEMYGYARDEAMGQVAHDLLHTCFPRPFEEIRGAVLCRGRWEGELTQTTRHGDLIVVASRWAVQHDEHGEPIAIFKINNDITERKAHEEQLRTHEAVLREQAELLDLAQDGILSFDLYSGSILFWNHGAERLYGWTKAEAAGKTPQALLSTQFPMPLAQIKEELVRTGQWEGELEHTTREGRRLTISSRWALKREEHGVPATVLAINNDITQRKRAEEELKRAKQAAESANSAKSEFLANMSHEIRTPMNGVIGMTDLLLDTRLTPEQREYAETVSRSGENLLMIINDILDFSKIEAGKMRLEEFDFDLQDLVEDVSGLLAARARDKGLEMLGHVEPDVPRTLRGDPFRLRQILTNLLGNAIKFTDVGEVVLRAALVTETPDHVLMRFEVRDTGIGVTPEQRARLFQAFSQADASTTRKYGGTGLGLVISRQLVDLMGGEMGIQSAPGIGSTFWFTARLPKQAQGAATSPPRLCDGLSGFKVLIVDDNATNRRILEQQTASWSMDSRSADGAAQGLEMLRAAAVRGEPYDLAILDMQMPDMDGLQLAHVINDDPAIANVRLVMLTSIGHAEIRDDVQAAGIKIVLSKPVRQSQLYDSLLTVLGSAVSREDTHSAPHLLVPTPDGSIEVGPAPHGPRILLAEDNAVNQKLATLMLQKLGYRVDVAKNGREAVRAHTHGSYAAVLMDCQMPEMDGFEATRAIRDAEIASGRHIPIIAMTANAMEGDREACIGAGMDDYLSKPVKRARLGEVLAHWATAMVEVS
ncbi:MAG: response regulator, partial [Chloroflexota bacterium]|nr:response regulator [Chloroflexota bacterium]